MGENKNSTLNQNMKYIFIIIGLVAMVLSYFLVFQRYNTKASDVKDEKNQLSDQYDKLNQKNMNRKKYEKDIKENKQKTDDLLKKFDGGITDESQIMDCFNISNDLGVSISNLTLSSVDISKNYVFGNTTSSNPDAPGQAGLDTSYAGISKNYSVSLSGSYDQVKEYLTKIMTTSGKRKVPATVSFNYDLESSVVTINASINEYAITGNDRKMQDVVIPSFNLSTPNIFKINLP